MPARKPHRAPSREELERLYVTEDLTVTAIAEHLNLSFNKTKEYLLKHGLWSDQKARRNQATIIRKPASQLQHVNFEPMDAGELVKEAVGEAGEAQAERSEAEQLPAVVDTRNQVGPGQELDDTAWSRLNARQKQTALTFVRAMTQPIKPTYQEIAAEAGISYETLRQDMSDVDFQEVTTELLNRDARFLINSGMKQDLVRLLDAGKLSSRNVEVVLKYLGELQADTLIQIANVLPHRSNDPKLPY